MVPLRWMVKSNDTRPPVHPEPETLYLLYFSQLVELATSQFAVPKADAEEMAYEVLIAAMHRTPAVANLQKWFEGAMICAAMRFNDDAR